MLSSAIRAAVAAAPVFFLSALAIPAGCTPAPPARVAAVTLGLDRSSVPFGASIEATIQFDVGPVVEPLDEDYRVLLHVLDDSEALLWSDDHDPPVPTSAWQPGQSIRYRRRIRVPAYPYVGPAVVAVGLYLPRSGARLALAGQDLGELVYRVATVTLEPPHESNAIVFEAGWHRVEFGPTTEWRWTTARAVLSFRNPHRAVVLCLDVQGSPELFDRPQELSLVVGESTLRETTLDTNRRVRLVYDLTAAELGGDDVVRLELHIDQTFMPPERDSGAADTRELGIRLFDVYVEPPPR